MGLVVRTCDEFEHYECSTKCILPKTNGKCADQVGCMKAYSGQYLCCSHATTSFLLMTKILCVPLDH